MAEETPGSCLIEMTCIIFYGQVIGQAGQQTGKFLGWFGRDRDKGERRRYREIEREKGERQRDRVR
jgi:hypothetical protein